MVLFEDLIIGSAFFNCYNFFNRLIVAYMTIGIPTKSYKFLLILVLMLNV